ncbi:MAG TPA: hypothetical protein VF552_00240 [Allosphingosinicella sp.]
MRRYSSLSPMPRRRRSPLPAILLILLVALIGLLVWLSTVDTEVPLRTMEQDVTNAALAK